MPTLHRSRWRARGRERITVTTSMTPHKRRQAIASEENSEGKPSPPITTPNSKASHRLLQPYFLQISTCHKTNTIHPKKISTHYQNPKY